MAKRVKVLLIDDLDDSEAAETVMFALDGITYEIDLNDSHATELRAAVQSWASNARRTGGRKSAGRTPSSVHEFATAIRHPSLGTRPGARRRTEGPHRQFYPSGLRRSP